MSPAEPDHPTGAPVVDLAEGGAGPAPVVREGRFPALNGLRAFAVLCVMATHVGFQTGMTYRGTIGAVLSRGDIGVTVFFLLSGFLLYSPFTRGHLLGRPVPNTRAFFRNRALRILPAYWLLLLVVLPTVDRRHTGAATVTAHVLLLQVYPRRTLLGDLTQTWSLAVEAAFYLALPLLALAAAARPTRSLEHRLRREIALLLGMTVVALVWTVAIRHGFLDERVAVLWLPQYLDWFALGMGLAVLRALHDGSGRLRALDQLGDAAGTCWVVAALLFWLTTTPLAGPLGLAPPTAWEALVKHVLYGLAATAVMLPAIFGTDPTHPVRELLSSGPAQHLGRISYGLFLWHLFALDLVFRLTPIRLFDGHALLVGTLTLLLSLALAETSFRLVEQPALRRKRAGTAPPP